MKYFLYFIATVLLIFSWQSLAQLVNESLHLPESDSSLFYLTILAWVYISFKIFFKVAKYSVNKFVRHV